MNAHHLYWEKAISRLRTRINLGWWLESWLSWMMGAGLLSALVILTFRWQHISFERWICPSALGLVAITSLVAWIRQRPRFESLETTRIRLEDSLSFHAGLTAAQQGVAPWPEPPKKMLLPLHWKWQRPLATLGVSLLLPALASSIPMHRPQEEILQVVEKPISLKQVETWVKKLIDHEVVSEHTRQDFEKKVSEILRRPNENWYEHGTLEAAGNLKEMTSDMLEDLARNLALAQRAAQHFKESPPPGQPKEGAQKNAAQQSHGPSSAQFEAFKKELSDIAEALKNNPLHPNESLIQQLQTLAQAESLRSDQLQSLQDILGKHIQGLQASIKDFPEMSQKLQELFGSMNLPGHGNAPHALFDSAQNGMPNRGPGNAPLTFTHPKDLSPNSTFEALPSLGFSENLVPGDSVGVQNAAQSNLPETYLGTMQGGDLRNQQGVGNAMQQNHLIPSEQETLKQYFKAHDRHEP